MLSYSFGCRCDIWVFFHFHWNLHITPFTIQVVQIFLFLSQSLKWHNFDGVFGIWFLVRFNVVLDFRNNVRLHLALVAFHSLSFVLRVVILLFYI
jgi:hypothetical protein